ncbi:cytochrome c biogenesis protein ResB [candidate division WOR-3 bacterium]|uniref:Cytochrome c biogenesis protein ResB n=1 Tax=candidate division WOR-3 bacterium TaxID=2052148 RepID=A0A937XBK8_UNCW3|nr:cytochrome c biogenesis protein ResB [candidate division WOR-3 bacterium]
MPGANTESPAAGQTPAAGPFWSRQWGWPHALAMVVACGIAAVAVQLLFPRSAFELPAAQSWPAVGVWCGAWVAAGLILRSRALVRGVGGRHFGMAALSAVALLSLPAAVFGWRASLVGMPMAVASAFLLANLSACIGRRLVVPGRDNRRFLLVHTGLLIVFAAMVGGRPQVERGALRLVEAGESAAVLRGRAGNAIALPFAVRLLDFRMEAYEPTLTIARRDTVAQDWTVQPGSTRLVSGRIVRIDRYSIRVEEFIARASVVDGQAIQCDSSGAGPAARVTVSDDAGIPVADGWLHNATPFGPDIFLRLATGTVLFLNPGKPKWFESALELDYGGRAETVAVAVNRPVRRHGWTLMQSGYDSEAGAASRLSVIEVVRDRALPFIYAGISLLLLGVAWMALAAGREREA